MKNEKWFALSVEQIEKKLKTNAASGLSRKAARSRCSRAYGDLFYKRKKFVSDALRQFFFDISVWIFLLCSVISCFVGNRMIGIVSTVLFGVVALALIALNCYCEKTADAMDNFFMPTVKTVREGRLYNLDHRELVPGDVIILERGDIVCCDARLVTSESLKVTMMLDNDNYIELDKQAEGKILGNVNLAKNHVNMLHAGSVVEEGYARALVVGVGQYTYLAARIGGIRLPDAGGTIDILEKKAHEFSTLGFWMMVATLPFCVVSMLFTKFIGGNSVLSVSFLTAITFSVAVLSRSIFIGCKFFYIRKLRKAIENRSGSVIRSPGVIDRFKKIKYLFLLDGALLRDGRFHYDKALCGDGVCTEKGKTMAYLSELAALYYKGESSSLSTGVSSIDIILSPLGEFIKATGVDVDALKIRCRVISCNNENTVNGTDKLIFADRGIMYVLSVSRSENILDRCGYYNTEDGKRQLDSEKRSELKSYVKKSLHEGKKVLVFSVSTMESNDSDNLRCLWGILTFSEGIDMKGKKYIEEIEKQGIKVISFFNIPDVTKIPNVPLCVKGKNSVGIHRFMDRNLPLTYGFGKIDSYDGFSVNNILSILRYAHGRREGVAVAAFSDEAAAIAEEADLFITCGEIADVKTSKGKEHITVTETKGDVSAASCVQTMKIEADMIVTRPSKNSGGMSAFINGVMTVRNTERIMKFFFEYLIASASVLAVSILLPMLFGNTILDARHMLIYVLIAHIGGIWVFSEGISRLNDNAKNSGVREYKGGKNKGIVIATAIASLICIFLPYALEYTELFGVYLYRIEYVFVSVLMLHIYLLLFYLYRISGSLKTLFSNKALMTLVVLVCVFIFSTVLFKAFGYVFGLEEFPFGYLLVSIICPIIIIPLSSMIEGFERRNKE